jgi:hypothetical protein
MPIPSAWPQVLDFVGTPLVIEPSPGQLSRDAGLLPIRQFDQAIGLTRAFPGGGSGLLVNEELARAVRHESAAAVMFWWAASMGAVCRWRKAMGVTRTGNEGTARLVRAAAELGAAELRGQALPPDQVERRRRTAIDKGLGRNLVTGYQGPLWTAQEIALLGTLPDAEVARRTGRTPSA